MSMHLLLMNLVAPALAVAAFAVFRTPHARLANRWLFLASAAQIAVLWLVHAPPLVLASMTNPYVHLAVQGMLFATALWFWLAILNQGGAERWRAILALLITGKLFCLLAALLVFSPRALYPIYLTHSGHMAGAADPLADQYLAGLLMLVICPLTYVFAGVLIAERWLTELRRQDADEISRTVST
jgi:putative membrane protein